MNRTDVFLGGGSMGYDKIRIPAIVVTSTGAILVFAEGRRNGSRDDGDIDLIVRRSTDGGVTWGKLLIVYQEQGGITMGNPAPVVDRDTGQVHLLFTRNNMRAFRTRSADDGVSFEAPTEITDIFEPLRSSFGWVRVATGPCHGIQLEDGRLLATFWSNDKPIDQVHQAEFRCGTVFSDDAGKSWKISRPVPADIKTLNECSVYETVDGVLHLNIRSQFTGFRAVADSADRGETWGPPRLVADLPDPTCQGSTLMLDGNLFFSNVPLGGPHTRDQRPPREKVSVRLSRDGGLTWPSAKRVTEGPSGYSDLAPAPDGDLYVVYENGDRGSVERISLIRMSLNEFT